MNARPLGRTRLIDVAQHAGVSKSVASRVLTGDPHLSARQATRDRVLASAQELGYRAHEGARNLASSRSFLLALVVDDIANPFYAPLIKGALMAARSAGYALTILEMPEGSEMSEFEDLVQSGRADGIIFAVTSGNPLVWSHSTQIPHVFVNRRVPGSERDVFVDHASAGRVAMITLADLGHQDVLYVGGPEGNRPSEERRRGITEVAEARSLTVEFASSDLSVESAYSSVSEALATTRAFTAVIASSWLQVLGARARLLADGIRIPHDVSVIVCDDLPLADHLYPAQATVSLPQRELGRVAVEELIRLTRGEPPRERSIEATPMLIQRGSLAAADSIIRPRSP